MNSYQSDMQALEEKDPKTEMELLDVLCVSPSSPEAYYLLLVLEWLRGKTEIPLL